MSSKWWGMQPASKGRVHRAHVAAHYCCMDAFDIWQHAPFRADSHTMQHPEQQKAGLDSAVILRRGGGLSRFSFLRCWLSSEATLRVCSRSQQSYASIQFLFATCSCSPQFSLLSNITCDGIGGFARTRASWTGLSDITIQPTL